MSRRLLPLAVLFLLVAASIPTSARADEILAKPLIRLFPQGLFCPLPVSLSFTAPASPVVITFTALEYADDSGTLTWTQQSIDNVTVATTAQVAANFAAPPAGSSAENCYIGDPVDFFYFDHAGLTFFLFELFDTDPGPRGWDLSHGGYFHSGRSAARDVSHDADFTGGSIGIGDGTDPPAAGLTRSTSITLSNLTDGVSYDLDAWWDVQFVRSQFDVTYLTITIATTDGTPVAQKSWGSIKAANR